MEVHPTRIAGRWREGFALDQHTATSTYLGDDEFGHPQFETVRSPAGELLYRLKYRHDLSAVAGIVEALAAFLLVWRPGVDAIVPVPASKRREVQPVLLIAEALAGSLGVPLLGECVRKVRDVPELKNVFELDRRAELLAGAHEVARDAVKGRRLLLLDDLFRSGATMSAIAASLYDEGGARDVFALTVTRTRSTR